MQGRPCDHCKRSHRLPALKQPPHGWARGAWRHIRGVCITFRARFPPGWLLRHIRGMTKTTKLAFGPGTIVQAWRCGATAGSYSWKVRALDRVPAAGRLPGRGTAGICDIFKNFQSRAVPVTVELRSSRWKCRNERCSRNTFPEALAIAPPAARKTRRGGARSTVRSMPPVAGSANGCDASRDGCQR
jgi:hypothetical protein